MREVTIATVQFQPKLGEPEENLVKMSDFISKIASQQKVDLIIFPELATSGYELGVRFTELAQRIPGPSINLMSQRAAEFGVHIAFGLATKERVESIIFNSAVLIGPDGELLGNYNKVHLRGEERMAFREGFKFPVINTEIGNIGLMLGWDLAFPEVARSLALEGAELLLVMANWEKRYMDEYRTLLKARAFENGIYVAGSNRVGEDVTLAFGGESMIVGPRGEVLTSLVAEKEPEVTMMPDAKPQTDAKADDAKPEDSKPEPAPRIPAKKESDEPLEGYAVARIDLDEVRRYREQFQMIQLRQPTAYRTVVKRY
ncbi:MAG: carbon-nitrogen hydrolase family protein [Chloroflexi bacterium]|nr:carbon-nitrogen hydrolase family protein [Chloroflexota bacterium]